MRRVWAVWAVWAAASALAGCQRVETPQQMQARMDQESAALKQVAEAAERKWESWTAAGQGDSIANLFLEQGREMPSNATAVVGRDAIGRFEAQNSAASDGRLTIKSETVLANGPLGVERGSFTFEGKAKKGAPKGTPPTISDQGKYLVHWHNVNGQWQIVELIWNSDKPPMMPAPAPKKRPAAKAPARRR